MIPVNIYGGYLGDGNNEHFTFMLNQDIPVGKWVYVNILVNKLVSRQT